MRASPLVLGGRQRDKMQHPLTGATCVALPNVGMCPQLSCALTFMYLQQVRHAAFPWICIALVPWRGPGRGLVRLDGRGASPPLVLRASLVPRAQLCLHLCDYLERLLPPSLGTRSLKLQTACSLYSRLSRAGDRPVVIWS